MPPTNSQPRVIAAGPPAVMAMPYDVIAPARIEMIENETAKLEKVDSLRRNSCWYPRRASSDSSSSGAATGATAGSGVALIGVSSSSRRQWRRSLFAR
jgi:hypothetical protein